MYNFKAIVILAATVAIVIAQNQFVQHKLEEIKDKVKIDKKSSAEEHNSDEVMSFVFELVRHGARAPIEARNLDKFPVSEG